MPIQSETTLAVGEQTPPLRVEREFSSRALVRVTGTWSGTLRVLAGMPDSTAEIVASENLRSHIASDGITTNGLYSLDSSGFTSLSVLAETLASGSPTVQVILVIG